MCDFGWDSWVERELSSILRARHSHSRPGRNQKGPLASREVGELMRIAEEVERMDAWAFLLANSGGSILAQPHLAVKTKTGVQSYLSLMGGQPS